MCISIRVIPFALALALVGCGGGSDDPVTPPPLPTPVNSAPIAVNDAVTTRNSVKITIAVLDNDTDADGDSLSLGPIIVAPRNGSATIEGASITYTPNNKYIGEDSITYQISDGEETAEAQVLIQSSQTITLSGSVLGTNLVNGSIVATVGGESTESTTNSDGSYLIDINLISIQGNVLLRAKGVQSNDQSQAELVSFLGATNTLFDTVDPNGNLDASTVSGLNIDQLTTARYLLADSVNTQSISVNDEGFEELLTDLNSTDLIELAAFIKLVINDNGYSLPVGQTTVSFFTGSTDPTPALAIRDFLNNNGLINSQGELAVAYTQDLTNAIATTVEQLKQPIEAQPVGGRDDATFVGDLRRGYLPRSANLFEFDAANTGIYWQSAISDASKFPFDWNINNGNLVISYDTSAATAVNFSVAYSPSAVERFGTEAQQKAAEIAASSGSTSDLVTITRQPLEDIVKIISFDKNRDQIFREKTELEILILNDGSQEFTYPIEILSFVSENKVSAKQSLLSSNFDVIGDWVVHFDYVFSPDVEGFTNTASRFSGDIVSFATDASATGQISAVNFAWSFDDSQKLILDDGTSSLVITPFMQNDDGMVAAYTKYVGNVVVARYVRELYQAEQTNVTLDSLQTILPEAYVSLVDATRTDAWETGLLDIDYVYAYNFKAGDSVDRLTGTSEPSSAGPIPYFTYDWRNRIATQTNDTLKFVNETDNSYAERTWHVIKTNSAGRIWVLEYFLITQTSDTSQNVLIALPRLNSIIKTDLSLYQDAWNRTVEKGIVAP